MANEIADPGPPGGLKADAIGFVDALVIGLNSTSPAYSAVRQAGRTGLDHAVRVADEAGVRTAVEIIDQKPAPALIDAAARHTARLIVVGTWGESPMRGALLGSTPHKLLHLSGVPVLCVPTER
ncbi:MULTISPECIES: universal stress protein [unclassified Streptomyces]|uniref:universal stress protein n=1 Tax=unclassified Streptomyces TaxID=2593676 RepID=UPI0038222ED4